MPGHVCKMRYPRDSASLFLSSAEAWLSLLFFVCLSTPLSLLLFVSLSCTRVTRSSTASPRFEMRLDRYVEQYLIPLAATPAPCRSPFRRLHYAMRILEERERERKGYFLQGAPGVWGRPDSETFLARRVMVCLKLNYRKCRAILDDWLNTHRKEKHDGRENL